MARVLTAAFLFFCPIIGCASGDRPQITTYDFGASADSAEADRLWEAAQDMLRRNRFQLDRVDRRAGVITTRPELSQNLFEFWRHDVDTAADLWESTLNPIRRWAEVRLTGEADGGRLAMFVHKQRLSAPDRQFNSTAAAYRLFSATLPTTTGQLPPGDQGPWWIDLGRDSAMESYLLRKILDRVSTEEVDPSARRG